MNSQDDKEKLRCMSERTFLVNQTQWELNCNWDVIGISDMDALKTLISFESRLDKFGVLSSEAKVWLMIPLRASKSEGKMRNSFLS